MVITFNSHHHDMTSIERYIGQSTFEFNYDVAYASRCVLLSSVNIMEWTTVNVVRNSLIIFHTLLVALPGLCFQFCGAGWGGGKGVGARFMLSSLAIWTRHSNTPTLNDCLVSTIIGGLDWKFRHESNCSASQRLPSDAEQLSRVAEFLIRTEQQLQNLVFFFFFFCIFFFRQLHLGLNIVWSILR